MELERSSCVSRGHEGLLGRQDPGAITCHPLMSLALLQVVSGGRELVVVSVTRADRGEFSCIVNLKLDTPSLTHRLEVLVAPTVAIDREAGLQLEEGHRWVARPATASQAITQAGGGLHCTWVPTAYCQLEETGTGLRPF